VQCLPRQCQCDRENAENDTQAPLLVPSLPAADLEVDFGAPAPGSADPMPEGRRDTYQNRIKSSVEAQAAGAEKASQLFVR
jgi:hypothetical protein